MSHVVVLSRSRLVAESLAGLVARWPEFDADFSAVAADGTFELTGASPDIVVVDGRNATDARQLAGLAFATWPGARRIVVERASQARAHAGSFGGAVAWLSSEVGEEGLRKALQNGPGSTRQRPGRPPAAASPRALPEASRGQSLTARESEVLRLLASGEDAPAIAARLLLSPHTVRTHIQNILGKLGVHSRFEAATLALRGGAARTTAGPLVGPVPGR